MVATTHIDVTGLDLRYGDFAVLHDVTFAVKRGDVFAIIGGSGSGKSTLFKALIGLLEPVAGVVAYDGQDFTHASPSEREVLARRFGVMFQFGALWRSLTLAENVALPLEELTRLRPREIRELCELKLALVGLQEFADFYPDQISGGMMKRAGLARAMALDPEILFFDEPSSGLDPVNARRLDDLILEIRDSLSATIVVVSHDLASIFTIANDAIFLDAEAQTITAQGAPHDLLAHPPNPRVHAFLTRSAKEAS
ncbi:MAG: ATP-binding cassette domain-containing protein [Kofleriaceae bacterium]|nr:ATP-binding cassette domain-containing protein [Kofleriaceae bacterium]